MSSVDPANRVKPIASFESNVVVLGEKRYEDDLAFDPLSELAPLDLAVGWGIMGQKEVRKEVSISQGRRRYRWRASGRDLPMEKIEQIGVSSANWHLIPASLSIRKKLMSIDKGDEIVLKGWLVQAILKRGEVGRSSLTRTDTGDGACEIIWVTEVDVR